MQTPTAASKLSDFFQTSFQSALPQWVDQLVQGDLRGVEEQLRQCCDRLGNLFFDQVLSQAAQRLAETRPVGCELRPLSVRLGNGHVVKVQGWYRKRPQCGEDEERHVLGAHWKLIGGASPVLYDRVVNCAMLAPSYEMAQHLLATFQVDIACSSVRKLTNRVADHCARREESSLLLERGESLRGKRVVISTDGGRTRIRQPVGQHATDSYQTPWREPKLFVIEVVDEEGRLSAHHLPIYGCRFGDQACLSLLCDHLQVLDIDQAAAVQLIADGARWIWNQLPDLLLAHGVKKENLIQTLDYYHAKEHLHKLCETLPVRLGKKRQQHYTERCEQWLWQGKADHIVRLFEGLYKRVPKRVRTELTYFTNHLKRTQYADYQANGWYCGSGIIESAVRRIINLRFKNTSSFWLEPVVEKLYFLRGAILAKRWAIVMDNLTHNT